MIIILGYQNGGSSKFLQVILFYYQHHKEGYNFFFKTFTTTTPQALRKKMEKVNNKTSDSFSSYPSNKINNLLEAMEDLQKHVNDFDKVVTDYKMNLDLTEHLQEVIEEVFSSCCCNYILTVMLLQNIFCPKHGGELFNPSSWRQKQEISSSSTG